MEVFFVKTLSICILVVSINLLAVSSAPQMIDTFEVQTTDEVLCPESVFTIAPGGRTANVIWEYISTLLFAKYLPHKQVPYTQSYILDRIINIFENTSNTLPLVEDIPRHCKCSRGEDGSFTNWMKPNTPRITIYTQYNTEQLVEIYRQYTGNIIVGKYAIFLETVVRNIDYVKNELRYKREWVDYSNQKFNEIKSSYMERKQVGGEDITFVGIHVRRTDYIAFINKVEKRDEVGVDYFKAAMQYFRDNKSVFGTPLFVVVSDEKDWVQEHLADDDVFIAASGDTLYATCDLALLSLCNHSIIDYGTYGLWGAVYTGGHIVTVQYKRDQVYAFMRDNPKWHLVDVNQKPIVVT